MAAKVIRVDGRPYAWRDLVELRQAQTTKPPPQPTLFDLRADSRPAGQRTAAERYSTPSLFDGLTPTGRDTA